MSYFKTMVLQQVLAGRYFDHRFALLMRQFCGGLDVKNQAAPPALSIQLGKSYAPHMAEVGEGTQLMLLGRARRRTPRLMLVVSYLFTSCEMVTLFSFLLFSKAVVLSGANRILVLERGCN